MPAFDREVYATRRRRYMQEIGAAAAALFVAPPIAVRSNDVDYPYRQDNELLYLTGFAEPESACLLLPGRPEGEFVLFVRARDPERETWTGRRYGTEGAVEVFGADQSFPWSELDERILDLVGRREELHYNFARRDGFTERVLGWMQQWRQNRPRTGYGPWKLVDPGPRVHEMRLVKSDDEVSLMRRAVAVSTQAHVAALCTAKSGMFEHEIEALIDGIFRRGGAAGPAYPSIIASGENATILHYVDNSKQMQDGELLLIDAGAEFQGYCADITRTFPLGSKFTRAQAAIYDIVLLAQVEAIARVRAGAAFDEPHRRAVEILVDGLLELGLLNGTREQSLQEETYRKFFMHRTGHWLGMDVHDVGQYKIGDATRVYEAGMVVTVEPGLYIRADDEEVPAEYRGIGIRIEDDVLVTASRPDILTADVPKLRQDVEAIRAPFA